MRVVHSDHSGHPSNEPPYRAAILGALALLVACVPGDAPATAAETALSVFELTREGDPDPATLDALFAQCTTGDPGHRGDLLDALESLGQPSRLQVTATEPLEGLSVTAVDLVGHLPGGGRATYTVHVESTDHGAWRVAWVMGPGVDWPSHRRRSGTGLSTSMPPAGPDKR